MLFILFVRSIYYITLHLEQEEKHSIQNHGTLGP